MRPLTYETAAAVEMLLQELLLPAWVYGPQEGRYHEVLYQGREPYPRLRVDIAKRQVTVWYSRRQGRWEHRGSCSTQWSSLLDLRRVIEGWLDQPYGLL